MIEMKLKDYEQKIFIDEIPKENFIPPSVQNLLINSLEQTISEIVSKQSKRKTYYQSKKDNKKLS